MKKIKLSANDYKRKLEHQIYLAETHPAKIYDLTDCNLNQIPKGTFTFCKVLRKYSLNLGENNLDSMQSGGNLEDLSYIGALILSNNKFKSLSTDFIKLRNLKKLLLDYNKLSAFPVILTMLPNLKVLNLQGNLIKVIPKEVSGFKALENLNLSKNPIKSISVDICEISTLSILQIDLINVENVPKSGINEVWKHFCQIKNIPIRKINENINERQTNPITLSQINCARTDLLYTKMGEEVEREILEHEQNVSIVELTDRRESMDRIKKLDQLENNMISTILMKKRNDYEKLMDALKLDAINTNELINKIFEYNNKAKKREELRYQLEDRSIGHNEIDYSLTQESKFEILKSMKELLQSENTSIGNDSCVINVDCAEFCKDYQPTIEEVNEQKLAFKKLQYEKDPELSRLRDGITLVEKKLQQLTVEDMTGDNLIKNFNAKNRSDLVDLLQDLKSEKDKREKIIDEKIEQLENIRDRDQSDFWIAQYQNLLDDRLKSDFEVQELLKMADMKEWIPTFLNHGYTIDMMLDLTIEDLNQLKIKPDFVKHKFLLFLNEWKFNPIKSTNSSEPSAPSINNFVYKSETNNSLNPSAPPMENSLLSESNDRRSNEATVLLARKEAECCICLTLEARILLLNCGHVCCCKPCSFTVNKCPLCREPITQRVNLEFSI